MALRLPAVLQIVDKRVFELPLQCNSRHTQMNSEHLVRDAQRVSCSMRTTDYGQKLCHTTYCNPLSGPIKSLLIYCLKLL